MEKLFSFLQNPIHLLVRLLFFPLLFLIPFFLLFPSCIRFPFFSPSSCIKFLSAQTFSLRPSFQEPIILSLNTYHLFFFPRSKLFFLNRIFLIALSALSSTTHLFRKFYFSSVKKKKNSISSMRSFFFICWKQQKSMRQLM